jgi:hypothetical protein
MTRLVVWCVGAAVLGLGLYFVAFWFYPEEGDASWLNSLGLVLGALLFVGSLLLLVLRGALYVIRGRNREETA